MSDVEKLAHALDIVASRCPRGLAAIVGEAEPPSRKELLAAATWHPSSDSVYVAGNSNSDPLLNTVDRLMEIQEPLDKVTWSAIVAAGQEVRNLFPMDWEAYRLHVTYVDDPIQWRTDEAILKKIAISCKMDIKTVTRRRREVPLKISRAALWGAQLSMTL